jgi:hypothetical protein
MSSWSKSGSPYYMTVSMCASTRKKDTNLGDRGGEDDNLVKLAHSLHELIYTRSFDYVDIMILALNLDGYREVGLV